jgi:hypothetical protein
MLQFLKVILADILILTISFFKFLSSYCILHYSSILEPNEIVDCCLDRSTDPPHCQTDVSIRTDKDAIDSTNEPRLDNSVSPEVTIKEEEQGESNQREDHHVHCNDESGT